MANTESIIAKTLNLSDKQVQNTIKLIEDGATIPFISRYRKEKTGALNEVQIQAIKDQHEKLVELEKRKESILKSIEDQGKLTDEIKKRIESSWSATEIEDIYLPFKPKRRTRAEAAREKGLEPLAKIIMKQAERDVEAKALQFVKDKVESTEEAINGAKDIIAEWISESELAREKVRNAFRRDGIITSKVVKSKEKEAEKYRNYFDISETLRKCSSHRLLAMRRGEAEGFLRVSISPDDEDVMFRLKSIFVKANNEASKIVECAVDDSYKRLIKPSIETEFAGISKEKADDEAIRVFAENLRQLLLSAPLGQKNTLAIDPGYRTGCKVVCLDKQGNLLHNEAIFPHQPQNETLKACETLKHLVKEFNIEVIAIGNGTAGRETEQMARNLKFDRDVQIYSVNENGASIYSASQIARDEFPEHDVTVRGAVSIGRRLMDPLAELVKIDPKSIGVGQYQYDVDQSKLKKSLDQTVINCVNLVGVNLNTASSHLLTYVSGLGPQLAKNIVEYRTQNGAFKSRKKLKKVPRLGEKAFEQCAGFLRIDNAENPLDNSAVHPESYHIIELMAKKMNCTVSELIEKKELQKKINIKDYVTDEVGLPTLKDIMQELEKPGRDIRQNIKQFEFDNNVKTINDLREGMILPGIVTNITNFGAFVDIGIKENGLVHISQITKKFITNPTEIVSLNQQVEVKVLSIDNERKRIQLTMIL